MNRTSGSIISKSKRMGLKVLATYNEVANNHTDYRHWSHEEDTRMVVLYKSGCTRSEITSLLGRSYSSVSSRLFKLGVTGWDT